MKLLVSGGTLVTPGGLFQADVFVSGETIVGIGRDRDWMVDRIINATGCYVFPGAIDAHVHMGFVIGKFTSTDDFDTGTRAAAYGGVTTLIDFAVPLREETSSAALQRRIKEAQDHSYVDFGIRAVINRISKTLDEEIQRCITLGAPDFKVFTVYEGLALDDGALYNVMKSVRLTGGLVMVHAENAALIEAKQARLAAEGKLGPYSHYLSRFALVEAEAVQRVLALQEETQCPLHFAHISAEKSIQHIQAAKQSRRPVTAETCPHYLFHTCEVYKTPKGALYMVSPAIKTEADRHALWRALAEDGIDTVATDHCPFNSEQKMKYATDFRRIPTGLPGIETTLSLLFTAWQERALPLERLVEVISTNPAKRFGLFPRKGTLQPGSDADIVIYDPRTTWQIGPQRLHMNVDWNPFTGRTVRGRVRTVLLRGEPLVEEGEWRAEKPRGQFQRRSITSPGNRAAIAEEGSNIVGINSIK